MRLWHEALIPYLPRQQLLGLHREVCALRGLGWGKKHATVDYVFKYTLGRLFVYHFRVMNEMKKRGYKVAPEWLEYDYRGKSARRIGTSGRIAEYLCIEGVLSEVKSGKTIYPEHNDAYLKECLDNLEGKGIHIKMEEK